MISTRPRLLLTAADKTRLLAKKNANDAAWQALKARADALATYTILQYKSATRGDSPAGTIFYAYQGEGWLSAGLPLALAYQMTADTKYSSKLIQLAQEMIRAQSDPDNDLPNSRPPIRWDNYYPSRNLASTLAFIYDYCYDQLSAPLRSQIVTLMNDYFDDLRVNGYQAQNYSWAADGNFFGGHLYGVALMGYASFGDNPRAQEMIEWARIRFDGTTGPTVTPERVPFAWRSQSFDGGQSPGVARGYLGPPITGNPFKGGFDFQAWSYGSEEYSRMIDYMLTVKSATGEDVLTPHMSWFSQILRAEKHALFPNRFMIDPTGDWGGTQGAVIIRELPIRLAFIMAATADGPAAQHFAYSQIAESTIPGVQVYPAPEWVEFLFTVSSRPSAELVLPPYYTGFAPNYPQGAHSPGGTNGAIPYFIMRSDWSAQATWASVQMGTQWWDDHQLFHAGHMVLARGGDYLLVAASDWKGPAGGSGVLGDSLQLSESSLANTLYFDDFGDHQGTDRPVSGGQSVLGIDEVVADELNADLSYVRSDLSTAYNAAADPAETPNRRLEYFYRNFLYLRGPNVFVVYDQVKARPSTNARGAYKKHIRWHMPNQPTISGRMVQFNQGQSRLFIDTVLPVNPNLRAVDEMTNPDPCDGTDPTCVPFGQANAATWRVEVRDPANPLFVPFLTVLQPGPNTSTAPTNTQVASLDGKMIGVDIVQAAGVHNIVLFNNQPGRVPAPITSTSYNLPGPGTVAHTLLGVVPNARYSVVVANGVVSVDQSASGDKTASPSGALHFRADAPGQPTLAINDLTVQEGNTGTSNAVFAVSISGVSAQTVTVQYATANGSASAGADYVAASGSLTFAAGEVSKTIVVQVSGDTAIESDETFTVTLSNPTNASIARAVGTGTIADDDGAASGPRVFVHDRAVAEGSAAGASFRIDVAPASTQDVMVNYATAPGTATAGSDYTHVSGSLTFTPGRNAHSVVVTVLTDAIAEGSESFYFNITSVVGATILDGQAVGTITDPPTPTDVPMYRAYNPNAFYHFFTTSLGEFANAVAAGYRDESNPPCCSIPFKVPNVQGTGKAAIYRMYNPNNGRHYYTASAGERDVLMGVGWVYEKDEGFVYASQQPSTVEVFKLYNNLSGVHLYTVRPEEKDAILAQFPGIWFQHTSLGFAVP